MRYDAIVVGGGFYGSSIACYLRLRRGFSSVLLIERENDLLVRASLNNQARIHNGYHYPRSLTTAYRSRVNFPRFVRDYPEATRKDFSKVYAIARGNSKITAGQFVRFCKTIGARLDAAPAQIRSLFDWRRIESVFMVEEYAFDAIALRSRMWRDLGAAGVECRMGAEVTRLQNHGNDVLVHAGTGEIEAAQYVFNCTYSGLNRLQGDFPRTSIDLKHEIAEMALVVPPPGLEAMGVTVMDGPFFSLMPFPARGLHTLSHVRYTPHFHWLDTYGDDSYGTLTSHHCESRFDRMVRDGARFLPSLRDCQYVDSLFEVKTVLSRNENDDGRPILFERHARMPACYSILGGKIDNIYDVLERLDGESLSLI